MKALLAMREGLQHHLFTPAQLAELQALVDVDVDRVVTDFGDCHDAELAAVEVLVTGWYAPLLDAVALRRMPRLRAVVHTAGSVRGVVGEAAWERTDLVVTTAAQANAVPVAEYTLAQVLLAGKQAARREHAHRQARGREGTFTLRSGIGNYRSVVGLVGASRIGRLVAQLLRPFDLQVLLHDPYVGAAVIEELGATPAELPELFTRSDVVSLHVPDLPETRGLASAGLLARLRDGATVVNTARPAVVDLAALRAELASGRLDAVLDVHDELSADDPLWTLPNVTLTPHLAGSQGNELHRLAESALTELRRLRDGLAPLDPVDRRLLGTIA